MQRVSQGRWVAPNGAYGNIVGVAAMLAALADNGGPTLTHALLTGSPAIDAGDNTQAINSQSIPLGSDQRGKGFSRWIDGNRSGIANVDIGAFETLPAPVVDQILINDGHTQRSAVDHLEIHLDQQVDVDLQGGSPFSLVNTTTGESVEVTTTIVSAPGALTVIRILFLPGPSVSMQGMLLDGNYRLTTNAVRFTTGPMTLDGSGTGSGGDHLFGEEVADNFFRFFGDSDGDRDVDGQDYGKFGLTFLKQSSDPAFNAEFDSDGDGDVDGEDYGRFRLRLLKALRKP